MTCCDEIRRKSTHRKEGTNITELSNGQRADLIAQEEAAVVDHLQRRTLESTLVHDDADFLDKLVTLTCNIASVRELATIAFTLVPRSGPELVPESSARSNCTICERDVSCCQSSHH